MVTNLFTVSATSDKIWNQLELIKFLSNNQNKDITLTVNPEAICLDNLGLFKILDCFQFKSVTIHTWNPLEKHSDYSIKYNRSSFWFNQIMPLLPNTNCMRFYARNSFEIVDAILLHDYFI